MKRIEINETISSWDEGIPLGCGKLGSIVYGASPLKITVDRVDLWDLRINEKTSEEGFCFENLVKLSKSEAVTDWQERDRLFEQIYDEKPYPSKITAGRIELEFRDAPKNVKSVLDLKSAVADFYENDRKLLEIFNDANRFVGVMRVHGDFSLRLRVPTYLSRTEESVGKYNFDYPRAVMKKEGEYVWYEQNTHTNFRFGIVTFQKRFAEYTEIYYTLAAGNDKHCFLKAKEELQSVANVGYDILQHEHKKWWGKYWRKASISIEDKSLEEVYYKSWYLFASCSRKGFYPMPLQGVWTADNDNLPPWRGDYHHDTNTQLSYQAYLKGNHLDEGRVFIEYLWGLKKEFQRFAKSFYGVEGLLIPGVSTISGKPMGGWAQYALSPTMSVWSAQSFDEYWLYTGDKEFLETRAYPFLKGVGDALAALLEEKNGKLYLPLTSSPEIFDATKDAYLEPNSNFDLALLRYLYKTLVCYCRILKKDESKYAEIYNKLDEIALIDGCVSIDKKRKLHESHRHFSHLMCMYPLHLINYDTSENKKVYKNTISDIERLGTGMWVGFSFAMCAQIYAMAHMGNAAYEKLRQFADGFVAENGFHLNGDFLNRGYSTFHYRPFTLEGLFGFCDALQEMLLQEHQGYIDVFPAIPDKWENASFRCLRSYHGVEVSAWRKKGTIKVIILESKSPVTVKVKNNFNGENLVLSTNTKKQFISVKKGALFEIALDGKVKIFLEIEDEKNV